MGISWYSVIKLNEISKFQSKCYIPAFCVPFVDKLLNCILQIQVLAQDENEVFQIQENQEIQVICNYTCFVCIKLVQEQQYYVYVCFCIQCRSLTIRYNYGLKARKETYDRYYQHYNM